MARDTGDRFVHTFELLPSQAQARELKLGQHILAISGEIRRPGLEGGSPGVWGSCIPRFLLCCIT